MNALHGLDFLLKQCESARPKRVALACPYQDEALLSIDEARKRGFVTALLVGEQERIRAAARAAGVDVSNFEIIDSPSDEAAAETAVRTVSRGGADLLMKGLIKTAVLLKAVLNKEWGLRSGSLLSHLSLSEMPALDGRVICLTDGGMNMYPDLTTKAKITRNAVDCLHKLGVECPRCAALCASELFDSSAALDAAALSVMNARGQISGCVIDGPVGLDGALKENADLLIVPDIDTGNMLGKALLYFGNAVTAGILLGARVPVILLSRHDSEHGKLLSIALGAMLSDN